jgi:hypothetical protein
MHGNDRECKRVMRGWRRDKKYQFNSEIKKTRGRLDRISKGILLAQDNRDVTIPKMNYVERC